MKTASHHFFSIFFMFAVTAGHAFAGPGAWDRTYAPIVSSGAVNSMALQTDGKLVIGGAFTAVDSSSARYHLARLFSDGSLDTTFFNTGSGVSSTVWSLAVQTDGRIVIGGDFTSINGTARTRIARLNSNGTVDGSFLPTNTINGSVLAVAVQTNNAVIIGGSFNQGTFPTWNARLNADGTTDTSFSSFPNGAVNAIAIQTDGKIVIGGAFTTVNGATRNRIARLNADGSLDNTFQNGLTGASSNVRCIQIQSDGKILIGGDFTTVNGTSRSYVARLTTTGALDTGFNSYPGANGAVYALAVQPDGNVLIGGTFSAYASANLSRVARLYPDGTRDTTFTNFGINSIIQTVAVQSDGGILIGGIFTTINNTNWSYLGRLYGNLYPPEFVVQPVSRNTNVGANVTFSAQVSNPTTTSFQWRLNGNNISGATGTSYSLYNVQLSDAGNYSVFVTDAVGGTSSSNAVLNVGIAPAITGQPSSLTVLQGQSATFTVTATGTPLNYFWKKNGTFITGQTNTSLNFASVVATNAATYTCQVSNFLGSITSTGAVLTVAYAPAISVQPVGQTIGVGSNFTVNVTATGNPAVTYQWRTNGLAITGAVATSYTVTGAQTNNSADYDVVLTNSVGSITSSVATISVVYYPPTISQQPVGGNFIVGSNFTLSVSANGTAPLYWQWRTNGAPISGANASSHAITSAQLTDAGSYDVVVTNSTGSVTSSVAVVNVGYVPVVVLQPLSLTNAVGGTGIFSCIVTGSAPINLQWTYNGNPLTDETNVTLNLTNLQPANIGYYALTATNIFGGTVSSNTSLNLAGYDFGIWNGLVAYYPFNGDANDVSGNTNNGTPVNITYSTDRFLLASNCAAFDAASSSYVNLPTIPATLINRVKATYSFWMYQPAIQTSGQCPFSDWDDSTGGIFIQFGTSGQIDTCDYIGHGGIQTINPVQTNSWHHYCVVFDGTQTPTLNIVSYYVDGSPVAQQYDQYYVGYNTSIGVGTSCMFGGRQNNSGYYFTGNLDDFRIYNRALSSNEVAALYALEADVPVITQQPQAQTVNAGGTATYNVAATAANPLTYQWFKDGIALTGATNTSLALSNVQPNQIGYYSVTVSNGVAGVTSTNAALNLNGYNFSQWQGLVAYYPFNGNANDASGNGNTATPVNCHFVANRFGVISNSVLLNSDSCITTPLFSPNKPLSGTISLWLNYDGHSTGPYITGANVWSATSSCNDFAFFLRDSVPYIWAKVNDCYSGSQYIGGNALNANSYYHIVVSWNTNGTVLYLNGIEVGSTNNPFQTGSTTPLGFGNFQNVALPNGYFGGNLEDIRVYNRALSSDEVARLYAMEADVPVITQQPQAQTVNAGGTATYNVAATAANPLTYQWLKNGSPIIGATNAVLTLTNIQTTDVARAFP